MEEQKGCGCGSNQNQQPTITSGVNDLIAKVFVSSEEQQTRMSICRACTHYEPVLARCQVCGCFLEAKTRLRSYHCALDQIGEEPKW